MIELLLLYRWKKIIFIKLNKIFHILKMILWNSHNCELKVLISSVTIRIPIFKKWYKISIPFNSILSTSFSSPMSYYDIRITYMTKRSTYKYFMSWYPFCWWNKGITRKYDKSMTPVLRIFHSGKFIQATTKLG